VEGELEKADLNNLIEIQSEIQKVKKELETYLLQSNKYRDFCNQNSGKIKWIRVLTNKKEDGSEASYLIISYKVDGKMKTKSLGSTNNFVGIEGFLYKRDEHTAWKTLSQYVQRVVM
jgi:hypothetical protein